ncbi:MAG: hypothetical protein J6Q38_05060, partial [Clostridia bacterium]|nr:hypothetical protein [Clostridia bacterium]
IGGTATSLAVLDLRLKKYDSKIIDGHYISFERLIELKDYAYLKSPTYLSKNYAIEPKRAEVIAGGASIIIKILKSYGLDGISVSESDNLEGYLKYVKKYYGKKKT